MSQALAAVDASTTSARSPTPPPENGPATAQSMAKTVSPRRKHQNIRRKARIFLGKKRKTAVQTKAGRTLYRLRRALISHGILLGIASIVIGAIFAYYANALSLTANNLSRDALELERWTAEKDFREQCKAAKV